MIPEGIFDAWRTARQAWPGVVVEESEFADWVHARHEDGERAANLAWHDLYLACACARGDAAALAAFDAAFLPEVDEAVKRIGGTVPPPDEVRQVLREKLFVAQPGARPKIAEYSGRGPLRTWVRVAALRTGLNLAIQVGREVPFESVALTFLVGSGDDPELAYLKRVYTRELRAAFDEAFARLASRERNLLRYAFGEGLSVDAVGGIYGVHRATAARWITKAHENLVDLVKKGLRARLGASQDELASILRLIQSQFHITLDRYLNAVE
jgi:RNA polymerase sigma-70 factor (ECF subfamily)